MKKFCLLLSVTLIFLFPVSGQVQPSLIYNNNSPVGPIDLRTTVSPSTYYYLKEGETFSFRESSPGVRAKSYKPIVDRWDTSPYEQGHLRYRNGSTDRFIMNYRFLRPLNYLQNYKDGYPLIVLLHGGIERGNCSYNNCYHSTWAYDPNVNAPRASTSPTHPLLNNDHHLKFGAMEHLDARNLAGNRLPDDPTMPSGGYSGFVLAPQMLNDWDVESLEHMLRLVLLHVKIYNIDLNRIYVHGLSVGGYAVFEALKRAPWLFAAGIPICASKDGETIDPRLLSKSINIPIWIFQGEKDIDPTVEKMKWFLAEWKAAGGSVRYTEYPGLGHEIWNSAYAEPDFFSWLTSKDKSKIYLYKGNSVIVEGKKIYPKLILPQGFFAYQWEKDGKILPADSFEFIATTPGVYRARFSRVPNPRPDQWNRWSPPVRIHTGTTPSVHDEVMITGANSKNVFPDHASPENVNLNTEDKNNPKGKDPLKSESAGL